VNKSDKSIPKQLKGMERRKHIRLSLMGLASLTVQGGTPAEVYMGCLGRGGAGLYMEERVKQKQVVILTLQLMEERWLELDMKFAARVRWVVPVGKLFMVGLKFEKMADDRYALLLKHLKLMKQLQL
jgi:Tfp pilus assembly protein PilZ